MWAPSSWAAWFRSRRSNPQRTNPSPQRTLLPAPPHVASFCGLLLRCVQVDEGALEGEELEAALAAFEACPGMKNLGHPAVNLVVA